LKLHNVWGSVCAIGDFSQECLGYFHYPKIQSHGVEKTKQFLQAKNTILKHTNAGGWKSNRSFYSRRANQLHY
jgi:hypothetical protein